jgi:DNA-binding PucR family transcriptional regulator
MFATKSGSAFVRTVQGLGRSGRQGFRSRLYIPYNRPVDVTIADILRIPGLSLTVVGGKRGVGRPIRWVHVSELDDPTPWLKGGELLLTTGMGVGRTAARQRSYVRRLSDAGLAGLGFGLGFDFTKVPRALTTAADELGFPVFEVPFPVPFIAITEAVFTRLLAEQYEVLQRAVDAQHVLTRAVLEEEGVQGIARSLARTVGGWALLLDLHGQSMAAAGPAARIRTQRVWQVLLERRPEGTGFSLTLVDQGHHIWVQPVGAQGRVEAFLAVGKTSALTQLDRIVAGHALSLFAIELAKSRAVAEAERRLQGDFFDSLSAGSLGPSEATRGLSRFGFDRDGPVQVLSVEGGELDRLAYATEDLLSRSGAPYLISPHAAGVHVLVPDGGVSDLQIFRKELSTKVGERVIAGAGGTASPLETARSLRESRYALQVCRLEGRDAAGFEDLGTYRLLLSMADPDALRAFADALLLPLDEYDGDHGGELIPSLRAFLTHNARWETAAAELYVHRHTLRYRMRKAEELTGRDLSSSFDRMEFWLALRARELRAAEAD